MKIKKFNESIEYNNNEKKAIKAGYNIGDQVYNSTMKKYLTVVKDSRIVLDNKQDKFCTLGSIGENLPFYTKVTNRETTDSYYRKKMYYILKVKTDISDIIGKGFITKKELKQIIDEHINNL